MEKLQPNPTPSSSCSVPSSRPSSEPAYPNAYTYRAMARLKEVHVFLIKIILAILFISYVLAVVSSHPLSCEHCASGTSSDSEDTDVAVVHNNFSIATTSLSAPIPTRSATSKPPPIAKPKKEKKKKKTCPLCVPSTSPEKDKSSWTRWAENLLTWDGEMPDSSAIDLLDLGSEDVEEFEQVLVNLENDNDEFEIFPEFLDGALEDEEEKEADSVIRETFHRVSKAVTSSFGRLVEQVSSFFHKLFTSPPLLPPSPPEFLTLPTGQKIPTAPTCFYEPALPPSSSPSKRTNEESLSHALHFLHRYVTHDLSSHPPASFRTDLLQGVCRPVILVFAKGTGHFGNIGCGGELGQILARAMETVLDGQVAVQGVDYRALLAGYFAGGSELGVEGVANMVRRAATQCPDSSIILSGYSQGAQILLPALRKLSSSPEILSNIKAILTFGDPNHRLVSEYPSIVREKVWQACNPGDMVCDSWDPVEFRRLPIFRDSPHRSEFYYERIPEAVGFVLERVGGLRDGGEEEEDVDGVEGKGDVEDGSIGDRGAEGGEENSGGDDATDEDGHVQSYGEESASEEAANRGDADGEKDANEGETNEDGNKEDDAGAEYAGGEDAGGEDAGGEDAGGEDAGGEDAGGEDAGGEDVGKEDAGEEDDAGDVAGDVADVGDTGDNSGAQKHR